MRMATSLASDDPESMFLRAPIASFPAMACTHGCSIERKARIACA
jgi:hypothetical protein